MNTDLTDVNSPTGISKIVISKAVIQYGAFREGSNTYKTITFKSPYKSAAAYVVLLGAYYNTSAQWQPLSAQRSSGASMQVAVPNGTNTTLYWATIGQPS